MMRLEVEQFLRRSGMAPTRFGRLAARDPRLVFDMRRGRVLGPRLARRLSRFIARAETKREADRCAR